MAIYTVSISSAGSPDVVSLTDGSTYATLEVSAGRGPKGDGFTGGSYDSNSGEITFTSNDGIGFTTSDIRPEITAAVAAAEAAQSGAETAEAGAEAAQAATESIFDQFGDQYLGPKASDPTVDNDGDPLTAGDIYFNTTDSVLKFYSGSAWVAPESIATTAASDAQAAQAAAETAETNAETAQTAAEAAQAGAETAETNASASETAAAGSAAAASTSADEAAASAASINLNSIDINGGTIDGAVIGGTTPAAGNFTTGSFTGNVAYGDNVKATFGASSDLQIYHDGSRSLISDQGFGNLVIRAGDLTVQNPEGTETFIQAIRNGPVELYYDGSKKLETIAGGINVVGKILCVDELVIESTTGYGNIEIGGPSGAFIDLKSPFSDDYDGRLITDGASLYLTTSSDIPVLLKHNDAEKIRTTSTGISVTGNATFADNGKATFGASADLQIYHNGSNSLIQDLGTGILQISSDGTEVKISGNGTDCARFFTNGESQLFTNGNLKLATKNTGIEVTGTVVADGLTVDGPTTVNDTLYYDYQRSNFHINSNYNDGKYFEWMWANTDTNSSTWYKIADMSWPSNTQYDGGGFEIELISNSGNYGAGANVAHNHYYLAIHVSGGTSLDPDTAYLFGADEGDFQLRVVKTADATYELQIQVSGYYRSALVKVQMNATDDITLTPTNSLTTGSTTGTVTTPNTSTSDILYRHKFHRVEASDIQASYIQGDSAWIGDSSNASSSTTANLQVHSNAAGGPVAFGDETSVVISTNDTNAGSQGYIGSLWFGSQDIGASDQYGWKLAGMSGYMSGDTGTIGGSADLLFYTASSSQIGTERMRVKSSGDLEMTGGGSIGWANWTITESGGSLYFATGGTNKMKLDASGNLDVVGSVNSNATIT